ncbi:MAG: hypothetical protein Q8O67_33215 [Deltaproteobacteria bacterium]|nr:hypothetical protein [Deltaproteobacteria bacterium]
MTLVEGAAIDTTKVAWNPSAGFLVVAADQDGELYTRVVRDGRVAEQQTLAVTIPGFIAVASLVEEVGFLVGLTVSGGAVDVDVGFVALDDDGLLAAGTEPLVLHEPLAQSVPSGAFDSVSKTTLFALVESTAADGRRLVGVRINPDATQVDDTFVLDDEGASGAGARRLSEGDRHVGGASAPGLLWESQTSELAGFIRTLDVGPDDELSPISTIAFALSPFALRPSLASGCVDAR